MKLRWSVKQGGINVETYTKSTCSQNKLSLLKYFVVSFGPAATLILSLQKRRADLRVVQVVHQQQCNGHCLCDCPSTAVETATAQCTSRWAMARGHRLNTSIVLAAVHGLSAGSFSGAGFRGRAGLHSVVPFPLCPRP